MATIPRSEPPHGRGSNDGISAFPVAVFPGIENTVAITADHGLGRFDPEGEFCRFDTLSKSLEVQIGDLFQRRRDNPDSEEISPAVVVPPLSSNKWSSATVILGEQTTKRIYSPNNQNPDALTPFVARNRVRSIFTGMEMLLSYRNASMPAVPFYCPVLYSCRKTINDFPGYAGFAGSVVPSGSPAIEVLNFIGLLSPRAKAQAWVKDLTRIVRSVSINKDVRAFSGLEIIDPGWR